MISESEAVAMFQETVIPFVIQNTGQWIESPREKAQKIRIGLDEPDKIRFEFEGSALSFEYWRFIEAIRYIFSNKNPVIIGSLDKPNSLQGYILEIARQRNKTKTDLRCARHIADLLVLSGVAEYISIKPPKGQRLQGIKQKEITSL